MGTVVVERRFEKPVSLDFLGRADQASRWCLEMHRCRVRFQSLAADGLSTLCVYDAPDAEAMRRVSEQIGAEPEPVIWAATAHVNPAGNGEPDHALRPGEHVHATVDRSFAEPILFADAQAMEEQRSYCLVMHRVRHVVSYLSFDRRRMACVYAAPDVEAVRSAVRMTGLPFDSVRTALARD